MTNLGFQGIVYEIKLYIYIYIYIIIINNVMIFQNEDSDDGELREIIVYK